jgi:glycosyltransferase involved in cell wall biosynthesis
LKLLFPFVGDSVGGSHLSALELCKILKENGYEVMILIHEDNGPLTSTLKNNNIKYVKLKTSFLAGTSPNVLMILFSMIWNILPLTAFIKKNHINIIHGNDLRINLTWSIAAKLSGVKFIWHQRTILSGSIFWKCIVFLCNHFIAISQAVLNSAPNNIPNEKKSMIYNAFDEEAIFKKYNSRDLINKEFPECEDAMLLGYVGRLVSYKNVDFLIKCLPEIINSSKEPIHLMIIGNGSKEYMAYLRGIINDLNLKSNVSFMGFINNPSEVISGLDILLASSGRDAFGRTIIEAMLQSIPVLAANKGGHLEIVEDEYDGLLYQVNNESSFIKNAIRLIENESLREEIAGRAHQKCIYKFTKNNHFLSIEEIYKSTIKNNFN